MKRGILLAFLVIGILLISGMEGCVEQLVRQPEEKAKELADGDS